ncbi:MAG: two-component system response regulator AlgR [Granulosicoccus sp.]|jgi:two-component system response regulator AlgR
MLDIVIVDDESLARQRLQRMVTELGYEVSGEAKNTIEAMTLIEAVDPAIVLLDIEMPGESGIQLAEKVSHLERPPAIIFTTAYDQYALKAFETFAAGYLMKPVNREKLAQALEKAQSINKAQLSAIGGGSLADEASILGNAFLSGEASFSGEVSLSGEASHIAPVSPKHISVHSHRGVDLIAIESIRCFIADSKYITVQSTEGECLMEGTLKQLEADFAPHFIRVHRNALVSTKHINGLDRTADGAYRVRLKDLDAQPLVSRRYARKIKEFLDVL